MEMQWFKNLIENISVKLNLSRTNSPSLKVSNKTQIEQVNITQGLSYSDAKDLIMLVVDQKLIAFKDEAKIIFAERTAEFKTLLYEKIRDLPEEEMAKLREPDTQITLLEAANISGRKQNNELRHLLANLVVSRIKNDRTGKEELKNIVYNEAVSTVNKLTVDQLKILTLCFLLKRTKLEGMTSLDQFKQYLDLKVRPFIDFKRTIAEFEHLAYSGCASISIMSHDLVALFKGNYPDIFKEGDNPEELLVGNDTAMKLISAWKETQIKNMSLTSVGIAIASTFYEQTTGDKINIDIWIN